VGYLSPILRAVAMFFMRARSLLHPRAADGAVLLSLFFEIWPDARSRGFFGDKPSRAWRITILAILHRTGDYLDVCRGAIIP